MSIHLVQQGGTSRIVHLKSAAVLLEEEQAFEFLEIVQIFNSRLMFLAIDYLIANEIIFDDIFGAPIVPQQPQLNDMITKLLPLHRLIPIDINLLKKINQSQSQLHLQLFVSPVVIQVL